jgi:hypothetical protein
MSGAGRAPALHILQGLEVASPTTKSGRGDPWKALRGHLAIWPDRRIRWSKLSVEERAPDQMMAIADLPPPIRGALDALTRELSGAECRLPGLTRADLDLVPLPFISREVALERMQRHPHDEMEACRALRGATGPWRVLARDLIVLFPAEHGLVMLRSRIAAPRDRLCLGHVRFETGGAL